MICYIIASLAFFIAKEIESKNKRKRKRKRNKIRKNR